MTELAKRLNEATRRIRASGRPALADAVVVRWTRVICTRSN